MLKKSRSVSAITIFFLVELLIRMAAERNLTNFFKKGWNIFDFLIVIASIPGVFGSSAAGLRLLRLMRLIPPLSLSGVVVGAFLR